MIVYGTHEEIVVLRDFFNNLPNTELVHVSKVKFSDIKMIPLDNELLREMEKNTGVE